MTPEQPAGFAVMCDLQGVVVRVLRDDLALGDRITPGQTLTRLVDRSCLSKALSFLVEVRGQGAAFDWEMNVAAGPTALTLHFTGGAVAETLLIVGAASNQTALQLYAELLRVTNEQANLLRGAVKERVQAEHAQVEVGHSLYDEISRLNNDLVNLQRELAKKNAELEQRVAARTADLSQANAALTQALRVKNEFLSVMSHELRTPLTSVLALAEVLETGVPGQLTDKQRKYIQTIRASGQHLLDLINDVLDFISFDAGRLKLTLGPIAVEELCQGSLKPIQAAAQQKQLKITVNQDSSVEMLWGDSRRLKKMLFKLLDNAAKFTPEGGAIGLDVTGDAAHQEVRFSVWDTGIGITPADQERLFEPFVQLDSRLARLYEGTGMGLALVKRLAEVHGGRVTVESEGVPGKGSRFTVCLPWSEATRLAAQHLTATERA